MSGKRFALVVATQCRAMPRLNGLHEVAGQLTKALLDPSMGNCVPALPGEIALLGGRPADDGVDSAVIKSALLTAGQRAASENATLVLALLGHGFSPGRAPVLHLMGADSLLTGGGTAVNVPQELGYAVNWRGVNGVIALVDTCSAAAAVPLATDLIAGAREGYTRLAVLAGSGASQDAYDLRMSRALTELMDTGIPGAPRLLQTQRVGEELDRIVQGQSVSFVDYGGGLAATESLWLSRNRSVSTVQRPDDRSYRSMCGRYLDWAANEWRYIELGDLGVGQDAHTAGRPTLLPLHKMYVSLQADPRSVADRRREERVWQQDKADGVSHPASQVSQVQVVQDIRRDDPRSVSSDPGGPAGIALEDAFERHRILVVLGDPGSGKSVLCLWLGCELARQASKALRGGPGPLRIPMRFRAADYAKFNAARLAEGAKPGSVGEFLANALQKPRRSDRSPGTQRGLGYPVHVLQGMFERAMSDGEFVLLIDGLDELTDHRNEVIDALVAEVEDCLAGDRGDQSQVVITSRKAGYDEVYLTIEEAAHYFIRPMTTAQQASFVSNFFAELGAGDQSSPFLEYLESNQDDVIRRLAATPLLLTSMCSYWYQHQNEQQKLPASRAGLYRELILDTGFRWRNFRAPDGNADLDRLLDNEDKFLAMLSHVAVRIQDEHGDGRIGVDELLDTLDEALYGIDRLRGIDARQVGLDLLERIRAKVGILAENSFGEFSFIHQNFREYLTGYDLLVRPGDPGGPELSADELLFARLRERIGDSHWREPVLLALGECVPATRQALMRLAEATPDLELDLEEWTGIFLAAALERPNAETDTSELSSLLRLAMLTAGLLRGIPDALEALDSQLAGLRRQLGQERFDFLALSLFGADEAVAAPIAALYWRRRWLTAEVLEIFAEAANRDAAAWGWPIQQALRRAAAPAPLREVAIIDRLERPAADDTDEGRASVRLFELGRRPWEQQRQRADEMVIETPSAGTLPMREFFGEHPTLWQACLADLGVTSAICALFGGIDHHDALRWAGEYDDFVRLLSAEDRARQAEIERRAAELVPRFGANDTVHALAMHLDAVGDRVSGIKPPPAIDPAWLTRPSSPAVLQATRRWLRRAPGQADRLRQGLEQLAISAAVPADRADAELGLLMLDGRPMTASAASVNALNGALEATGDAMIRSHAVWFRVVWDAQAAITDAERAVLHRFLLRLTFQVAGAPVLVSLDPLGVAATWAGGPPPVLLADGLARQLLPRSRGSDQGSALTMLEGLAPTQVLGILAWLTTLPYVPSVDGQGYGALWQESMPRAAAALEGGLESALRPVLAWAHRAAPLLEPELSAAARAAFLVAGANEPAEVLPPAIAELYAYLAAARGAAELAQLRQVLKAAAAVPPPHTDLAYLLIGLAQLAPRSEQPQWQVAALDVLASDPDEVRRAEALSRMGGYLGDDVAVRERVAAMLSAIRSPILRADAGGDLAGLTDVLVGLASGTIDEAARVSIRIVGRARQELASIGGVASGLGGQRTTEHSLARVASRRAAAEPWFLDRKALNQLRSELAANPENDKSVAQWLSMAARITDEAVAPLTALLEKADPRARWVRAARDQLTLHRAGARGGYPGMFCDLAELVRIADAPVSARAQLQLLGPWRAVNRNARLYRLSDYGLERWWELGQAVTAEADPQRRRLLSAALNEWDIDSERAVGEAARRAGQGGQHLKAWLALIDTASIWREPAQIALASWLDDAPADPAVAGACLNLVTMLSTGHYVDAGAELTAAVTRACVRSHYRGLAVPGLSSAEWRISLARPVADACIGAITEGKQGPDALEAAQALLRDGMVAVITGEDDSVQADFASYGNLMWSPLGAHPADAAKFTPAELGGESAVSLLVAWAREFDTSTKALAEADLLPLVTFEAVLNLLVVLSARDGTSFRLRCPPEVMQPILSRVVLARGGLCAAAALTLLSRMRFVSLAPPGAPELIDVIEAALRGEPLVRAAAADFLATVRYIRGKSFAEPVLRRMRETANECVVQGLAMLAAAYQESPTCSAADRSQIQQLLRADPRENSELRPVYLIGTGNLSDPVMLLIGPDRRSVLRQLRHYADPDTGTARQNTWRSGAGDRVAGYPEILDIGQTEQIGWVDWLTRERDGSLVYLVRGKDGGRPAWHYVKVDRDRLTLFQGKLATGSLDVSEYGQMLYSGWGVDPPDDIRQAIADRYG